LRSGRPIIRQRKRRFGIMSIRDLSRFMRNAQPMCCRYQNWKQVRHIDKASFSLSTESPAALARMSTVQPQEPFVFLLYAAINRARAIESHALGGN
jgi:hypothetical protein